MSLAVVRSLFSFLILVSLVLIVLVWGSVEVIFCVFPALFGLLIYNLKINKVKFGPGGSMALVSLFIRYVIAIPLSLTLNCVMSRVYIGDADILIYAFFAMLAEYCILFYTFSGYYRSFRMPNVFKYKFDSYNFIYIIFILCSIVLFCTGNGYFKTKNFILNASSMHDKVISNGSDLLEKLANWFFVFSLCYILVYLNNIYQKTRSGIVKLVLIIIVFFPCLFVSGSSRLSVFVPSITSYYIINKYWVVSSKAFKLIFIFSLFLVVGYLSIVKHTGGDDMTEMGSIANILATNEMLSLYFAGIDNVVLGIKSYLTYYPQISFSTLIADMFGNMMGVSKYLSHINNSSYYFNSEYYGYNWPIEYADQIIPTCIQNVYFFFGIPIFTFLMGYMICILDKIFNNTSSITLSYICAMSSALIGFQIVGNALHLFATLWNDLLPLLFFVLLIRIFPININLKY